MKILSIFVLSLIANLVFNPTRVSAANDEKKLFCSLVLIVPNRPNANEWSRPESGLPKKQRYLIGSIVETNGRLDLLVGSYIGSHKDLLLADPKYQGARLHWAGELEVENGKIIRVNDATLDINDSFGISRHSLPQFFDILVKFRSDLLSSYIEMVPFTSKDSHLNPEFSGYRLRHGLKDHLQFLFIFLPSAKHMPKVDWNRNISRLKNALEAIIASSGFIGTKMGKTVSTKFLNHLMKLYESRNPIELINDEAALRWTMEGLKEVSDLATEFDQRYRITTKVIPLNYRGS